MTYAITSQSINQDRLAAALCGTPENYPFYLGKSLKKRLKAKAEKIVEKVQPAVQKYYGYAGKAVGYAAPIVGMAFGGTAGAAAGTAVGTAAVGATTKGNREAKKRAAIRFAKYGGAITVATGLTSLATGAGITQGFLTKGSPLLPGSTVPGVPADTGAPAGTEWDPFRGEYVKKEEPSGSGGGFWSGLFGRTAGTAMDRYGKGLTKDVVQSGIQNPYEVGVTAEGGAGGGASGGSGSPGGGGSAPGGSGTQYLIPGAIALAAAFFLLKR